jgi:hypothetical protein
MGFGLRVLECGFAHVESRLQQEQIVYNVPVTTEAVGSRTYQCMHLVPMIPLPLHQHKHILFAQVIYT